MSYEAQTANIDAERSVLGACLIDPKAVAVAVSKLRSDDFTLNNHRLIFDAIAEMNAKRKPVDFLTICDQLGDHNTRKISPLYISDLAKNTPSSANISAYCDILSRHARPDEHTPRDRVTYHQALALYELARQEKSPEAVRLQAHAWAIKRYPQLHRVKDIWPMPAGSTDSEFIYPEIDLCNAFYDLDVEGAPSRSRSDIRRTILDSFSAEVANKIQFPVDTAFAFGMGAIASAMTRQFQYQLDRTRKMDNSAKKFPCNMYVVVAQPAGSGKSGVHSFFTDPIIDSYAEINDGQRKKRAKLYKEIMRLKDEIKKEQNAIALEKLEGELWDKQKEMDETPVYTYQVNDATAEGLRDLAIKQNGLVNIVSDESDAVNVVLGSVYGDAQRKANHSMFLKAWDGEMHTVMRAGKEATETRVKGTLAVIAQAEAIDSILRAGLSGRGISERVLIVCEPDLVGHIDIRRRMKTVFDSSVKAEYGRLITSLVHDEGRTFMLSEQAQEVMIEYAQSIQARMLPSGDLHDPSLRGLLSKTEKHCLKIACVLHACNQWGDDGHRENEIDDIDMRRAIGIFDTLSKFYIAAAELHGYAGIKPKMERVRQYLETCAMKRRMQISIAQIRDAVKGSDAFAKKSGGNGGVTDLLKNDVLPAMEKLGVLVVGGDRVYLNPKEFS